MSADPVETVEVDWGALAQAALAPDATKSKEAAAGLGGDLITAGITNATKVAGTIGAIATAAGAAALTVFKPFFDHSVVAVAAGVLISAALLAFAWVLVADLRERAKVTVARLDSLQKLATDQLAKAAGTKPTSHDKTASDATAGTGAQVSADPANATPALIPANVFSVSGFDVTLGGNDVRHLVAMGWASAGNNADAAAQLMYLVAPSGASGMEWKSQNEIFEVEKVDKAEITNIVRVHHVDHA
ncbi:MAG TPA: hypothetical protein VGL51_09780 [Solirubrobacteraceae bacterium]|jgi:hypothetical protein